MLYPMTHCPNSDCLINQLSDKDIAEQYPSGWFVKNGTHSTRAHGYVQRFKCRSCGTTFSTQTFSSDYYTKKRIPLERVAELVDSSASIRSIARTLSCSRMSVDNRIRRWEKISDSMPIMAPVPQNESISSYRAFPAIGTCTISISPF